MGKILCHSRTDWSTPFLVNIYFLYLPHLAQTAAHLTQEKCIMKTNTIYSFAVLFATTALLLTSCAAPTPPPPTPTSTALPPTHTPTLALTSTPTLKPTATLTPTATPNAVATQQAEDFNEVVKKYYDAKYISTLDGKYTQLDRYVTSWAQINYYIWETTDYSPANFIIKSDISWSSASAAANSSGCGYVFRLQDDKTQDHYVFFLSLKGYVEMAVNTDYWKSLGTASYGNPAREGKAQVVLIAEDSTFRVLVNDKLIKTYTGFSGKLMSGDLAYTVISGINTSFGTQCVFENTELWTILK